MKVPTWIEVSPEPEKAPKNVHLVKESFPRQSASRQAEEKVNKEVNNGDEGVFEGLLLELLGLEPSKFNNDEISERIPTHPRCYDRWLLIDTRICHLVWHSKCRRAEARLQALKLKVTLESNVERKRAEASSQALKSKSIFKINGECKRAEALLQALKSKSILKIYVEWKRAEASLQALKPKVNRKLHPKPAPTFNSS